MKLIQTKEYLLLVDEEAEINFEVDIIHAPDTSLFNGFAAGKISKEVAMCAKKEAGFHYYKIVAYFPLTKDSKELDIPLLPNPFKNSPFYNQKWEEENQYKKGLKELKEDSIESFKERELADNEPSYRLGYVYGARAAENRLIQTIKDLKEAQSKQFSLEDMQKAIQMAQSMTWDMESKKAYSKHKYSTQEIIQSLSTQQLPKEFIPEYVAFYLDIDGYSGDAVSVTSGNTEFKIVINSESKQELIGTYKY